MKELSSSADRLRRPLQPMPDDVRDALSRRGLFEKYAARPAYQRNDYLLWISNAKRMDTRARRLDQMLDELQKGDVYMRMKWNDG
ncbi:MAG: YdeI/OmpD-associated family protein [Shinella sp.]|nr:YdeI/OmpD-associated family protein [Shinella sp.]